MAWSIFNQPNGDVVAVEWAVLLLMALGAPTNESNIQMVYNWERSEGGGGAFNPLNQGPVPGDPGLTTTGSQYGGGAADFASWQAGIEGAVAYLNMPAYSGVRQSLMQGNGDGAAHALWASPWAASHYGYGSGWNTTPVPRVSPQQMNAAGTAVGLTEIPAGKLGQVGVAAAGSAGQTATGGTNVSPALSTDASGNNIPSPPGMGDIPALVNYIKQYFGADAWLLNIPGVAQVIEQAVAEGRGNDTQYIQTLIEGTAWFKTTSKAVQTYEQQRATNPADYNFNVPGSLAAQTLADVQAAAAQQGVQLTASEAQALAQNYMQYGWDSHQLDAAIGDLVYMHASKGGQGYVTNAGTVIQQLQAQAGQYLMAENDPTLQSWAENIAGGTQTMAQFDAYLKRNASLKWTGMASQIAQGYTPAQIVSGLQQTAAQTMEMSPDQVDFINDPTYQKILDYQPPGQPGKPAPAARLMTQSEEQQYLKGLPQWGQTLQAKDQVGTLASTILQTFGKAP